MYTKKAGSLSPKNGDVQKRGKSPNNKNHAGHSDSKPKRYSLEPRPSEGGKTLKHWDEDMPEVTSPIGYYHTVSGVNATQLKDALSKNIYLHSVAEDGRTPSSSSSSKKQGIFSKRLSVSPRSRHGSTPSTKHTGKVKQFFGSLKNRTKSMTSESSGKDHLENSQLSCDGSFHGQKPRFSVRSPSPSRETEIGPSEYIQMYRERTFSDTTKLAAARQAVTNKGVGRLNRSFHETCSGDNLGDDDVENELHYLVWRDRGDTTIYKLPTATCDAIDDDDDDIFASSDACFARFLNEHTCYDLIPTSSKIVVFDTRLTVKKAFNGLVINGVKAGILWDSKAQTFTGMLTVTDFIKILDKYHSSSEVNLENLENDSISKWKSMLEPQSLVQCSPENKLLHGLQLLTTNKVHRLLVVDKKLGNPVNVLTHKRMLNFLHMHMHNLPEPSFLKDSISTLGIGTFQNLATITFDTTLIEAVRLFLEYRVSAVPVVNSCNKLVGIFSKFDFSRLAYDKLYNNLDLPVREILPNKPEEYVHMFTCKTQDTLKSVIGKIVSASVHRLIVVNKDNTLAGILSLSDILKCLVFRPLESKDSDSCEETEERFKSLELEGKLEAE